MKQSKYNVFLKIRDDVYVINTLSKGIAQIEPWQHDILASSDPRQLAKLGEDAGELYNLGILVDAALDEVGSLRYAYHQSQESTDEMEFVVAPTMDCNFRCTYCFETPRHGVMEPHVADAVLEFIKARIEENDPNSIRFIWFGGEPLLAIDIIEKLSMQVKDYLSKKGIHLNMIVITNGYFITEDVVSRLLHCGVNAFQITLDGAKSKHDQRRLLANGRGTYDAIVNNLKHFKGRDVEVGIRVNIDKENLGSFGIVSDELGKLHLDNIKCRPALVEPAQNHDANTRSICYASDCTAFYESSDIKDYYSDWSMDDLGVQLCYCGAEHRHSYAIDEKGNLYKCWNSMGVESEVYGSVFNSDEVSANIASQFLGRDPFTEAECRDCPYMPICGGGCLEQLRVTGKHSCSFQKYILEDAVRREIAEQEEEEA